MLSGVMLGDINFSLKVCYFNLTPEFRTAGTLYLFVVYGAGL